MSRSPLDLSRRVVSPTDISQYLSLSRCERFLRLRLYQNEKGIGFLKDFGVEAVPLPPLLSESGLDFEENLAQKYRPAIDCKQNPIEIRGKRQPDNSRLREAADRLLPNKICYFLQPRLVAPLGDWEVRGDADLVQIKRDVDGTLSLFVLDFKSSSEVKVEHRLQVAFYKALLTTIFPDTLIRTGVQCAGGIEKISDQRIYDAEVLSLVTGGQSSAGRIATLPFDDLFFSLSSRCEGCPYQEFCFKDAHETRDLSLLPHLTSRDKKAFRGIGLRTVEDLANLDNPEALALLAQTSVGAHQADWIAKAKGKSLSYKSRLSPTLPALSETLHPNLIMIFLEAQEDYVERRLWFLSAKVQIYSKAERISERTVVCRAKKVIRNEADEAELVREFVPQLIATITENLGDSSEESTAPIHEESTAPIHLVFWDKQGEKAILSALERHFDTLLELAPVFHDFLTQPAAHDSPLITHLAEEVKEQLSLPMLCQSLPTVARYLGYSWADSLREKFFYRVFDGREKDDSEQWYESKARFSSQVPLEYAYAAWEILPAPKKPDAFAAFRPVTSENLDDLLFARLEAMAFIASKLPKNTLTEKTPFLLEKLWADSDANLGTMAHALTEFLLIERHVFLAGWKNRLRLLPESRALRGETLVLEYRETDQPLEIQEQMADFRDRQAQYESYKSVLSEGEDLTKEQKTETKYDMVGMTLLLRLSLMGIPLDAETLVENLNLKDDDPCVLAPVESIDTRLPEAERVPFPTTVKQLLRGMRVRLKQVIKQEDGSYYARIEVGRSMGDLGIFTHYGRVFPLEEGARYTLDTDPDDLHGYRQYKVTTALEINGETNTTGQVLYEYLHYLNASLTEQTPALVSLATPLTMPATLTQLDLEPSKQSYIFGNHNTPVLIVQGPPGTGKTFSTGFAVIMRLLAALSSNQPCRIFLSCKTHAATDVLLKGVWDAWVKCEKAGVELPFYRLNPRGEVPDFVEKLPADKASFNVLVSQDHFICAGTPGALYQMMDKRFAGQKYLGKGFAQWVILDEASQMSLPEAMMATLPLASDGKIIVVGDPRQMPPIIQHAWDEEPRRLFQKFRSFDSLFNALAITNRAQPTPKIAFEESFRLHRTMAEFLRKEIYEQDNIAYFSQKEKILQEKTIGARENLSPLSLLVAAALNPDYPLVVIVHEEQASQTRNGFEADLVGPILAALKDVYGLDSVDGLGVVVPHRAQRVRLRKQYQIDSVETVEKYQGDEREVILISTTESDPEYLMVSAGFLLDPRRLTVALSRAKKKMILVASRSVFEFFSSDPILFANSQMWKNLLRHTCTTLLWEGEQEGKGIQIWGAR